MQSRPLLLIDFVADFVCPWCHLGRASLDLAARELAAEFDIKVRHRAYQLDPDLPPGGIDRARYYARRFPDPERLAAARAEIVLQAREIGLDFDPSRPAVLPNTLNAHRLARFAEERGAGADAVAALYDAYWNDGADIESSAGLGEIAAVAGLRADEAAQYIASGEGAADAANEAAAMRAAGVSGVPTFIVNEKVGFSGALPPPLLANALREAGARGAREDAGFARNGAPE
jgi:predicted DsbA family dithiol-disulfide isomerase